MATRRRPRDIVPSPQCIEKAPRDRKSIPRMTCAPYRSRGITGMAGRSMSCPLSSTRAATVPRVLTFFPAKPVSVVFSRERVRPVKATAAAENTVWVAPVSTSAPKDRPLTTTPTKLSVTGVAAPAGATREKKHKISRRTGDTGRAGRVLIFLRTIQATPQTGHPARRAVLLH